MDEVYYRAVERFKSGVHRVGLRSIGNFSNLPPCPIPATVPN